MKLRRIAPVAGLLAAGALALSACGLEYVGTGTTAGQQPAARTGTQTPDVAQTPQPPKAPQADLKPSSPADALVVVQAVEKKGWTPYLQTADGKTIYRSDNDDNKKPESHCVGECAKTWIPVRSEDVVLVKDVDKALVSSVPRPDASGNQLAVKGWLGYTFVGDTTPGATNGQGKNGFFAMAPDGTKAQKVDPQQAAKKTAALLVTDTKKPEFKDTLLVNGKLRAMYIFDADKANAGTSACEQSPGCDEQWPPVLADQGFDVQEDCVDPDLIGTFTRKDGRKQITINGLPVYYFAADKAPKDTLGHGQGSVWWVASGDGKRAQKVG